MQNIDQTKLYDVIIVGGGPAGLTAALYLARARYRVLVVEKMQLGGQITITEEVVNYPGVARTSGHALADTMRQQAESFGAAFLSAEVKSLSVEGDVKTVHTTAGDLFCFGILLATGAHPRMVGFAGEQQYRGRGVAYCATCDGGFYTGKKIFVVGGGFAAAEEGVFLTKYGTDVTIMMRKGDFSCAPSASEHAKNHEKITVLYHTEVEEVRGGDMGLTYIRYKNNQTGEVTEYRAAEGDSFGVFVLAGYAPETALVQDLLPLSEGGYVQTDKAQRTAIEGLFAAGDVCEKPLRQVVTAVGDGAIAATELEKHAAAMQKKTGLHPALPEAKPAPQAEAAPQAAAPAAASASGLFDQNMLSQLNTVFSRMENALILEVCLDDRPVSNELSAYMGELCGLTDKLTLREGKDFAAALAPFVRVLRADGSDTGLAFHGVPGGHEFTSFVLGLYNAAGPGQALGEAELADIRAIDKPVDLKILVSLSCTMCPDLVVAAQRIASLSDKVRTEVYDLNHFAALREQYKVMSVPVVVCNDGQKLEFGKKNIRQLLDLIATL